MKIFTVIFVFCFFVLFLELAGRASTVSDSGYAFPSIIDLSKSSDSFITIKGPSTYEKIEAVATMDMNRDGFDDVIAVGFSRDARNNLNPTIIYVIYGSRGLSSQIDLEDPSVKFASIISETDQLYFDQLEVGDFNGDGSVDIFFKGATKELAQTFYKVYVFTGKFNPTGQTSISATTQGMIKLSVAGSSIDQLDNFSIADLNGDGRVDVLMSCPNKIVQGIDQIGKIYIVHGSSNMPSDINVENTQLQVKKVEGDTLYQNVISVPTGYNQSGQGGFRNFAVGDIDKDYAPDIVFDGGRSRLYSLMPPALRDPSMMQGMTYLIYGAVIGGAYYLDHVLSLRERLTGLTTFFRHSTYVPENQETIYDLYNKAAIGDINGDGYDDLFLAYPFKPGTTTGEFEGPGKIFVLYGSRNFIFSGDIDLFEKDMLKMEGVGTGLHIGLNFAFGDLNGDGYKDCLIGGANDRFYILYGRNSFPDSMAIGEGFSYGTTVIGGNAVCTGDVNGDGYADIIGNRGGKVFIMPGKGKTYSTGMTIAQLLPQSAQSRSHFQFQDGSKFHFRFSSGAPSYNTELHLTNFCRQLPDSLSSTPTSQKVISLIRAELINMPGFFTYRVQCSIDYTDSALSTTGIKEEDLVISYWNAQKSKWEKVETVIDTTLNRATFEVEHLSLFALTDKNDSIMTNLKEITSEIPLVFELSQNYPNPFNPATTILFQIPKAGNVSLKIYNILGQEVKMLLNKKMFPGSYELRWDGTNNFGNKVSSGIYIYRIETGTGYVDTKKMVFLK